jgi:hypothetical protein
MAGKEVGFMIAVSKAWNRLFHRGKDTHKAPATKVTPPKHERALYSEAHEPSGIPRVSPKERARRKAKRTAAKKARRLNRRGKTTNRRRSRRCNGGDSR